MNKEKLEADREKLLSQLTNAQKQLRTLEVIIQRTTGAISYIDNCLKEIEKEGENDKKITD